MSLQNIADNLKKMGINFKSLAKLVISLLGGFAIRTTLIYAFTLDPNNIRDFFLIGAPAGIVKLILDNFMDKYFMITGGNTGGNPV